MPQGQICFEEGGTGCFALRRRGGQDKIQDIEN